MNQRDQLKWVLVRLFLTSCLLLARGTSALAQVSSASIVGRIEDTSGAGVLGAMVTVTSLETGVARSVTADAEGSYRVLSVPVGRYDVKAEKTGFKVEIQSGIDLVVGQQAVVNLRLEVGQVQQQVTVTGEAALVNTSTESVSGLVDEKTVKDLPLNGRSFDELITLNAGTAKITSLYGLQVGAGGAAANQGQLFTVAGQRWGENLFLLNGVEYAGPSQAHSEPGGVSGQLLGVDAVREFNVETDTYGAQYGKRSGAQVSIVTMSGSNQLHGTLFEFVRNSVFDAKNYFDHPINGTTGLPERIPPYKRNQFGGALGGPIQKDKTFIFGNYEGFRERLGVSNTSIDPDNCSRAGRLAPASLPSTPFSLSQCLGAAPGLQAGMIPILDAYWPVPNGPELGGGTAEAFYNPLQSIREDFGTVRVDRTFSDKDMLSVNYLVDDGESTTPIVNPLWNQLFAIRAQVFSLQETHIFSPNLINTFTAGFSRSAFLFLSEPYIPLPTSVLFLLNQSPEPGAPHITAGNITAGGGSTATRITTRRTLFTYQDTVQVIKGRHQISAGVTISPLGSNELAPVAQSGNATFASLATFLQGTVQSFTATPIQTALHWRQLEGAWYVQDTIQLRRNLTARIGLRHEFTNGWNEAHNMDSNFEFGSNGVLLTAPVVGRSPYTQNNSKWLFGPRVGIAWDPFGKGKSSVRAGFGTYYSIVDVLGQSFLDRVAPTNGQISFTNTAFLPLIPVNSSTPLPPACGPGVPSPCTTYAPDGVQTALKIPTVEEWNLTVEQQITPNTSLRLSYIGSHGYHNEAQADPNQIPSQICSNAAGCTAGGNLAASSRSTVADGTLYVPVVTTLPNPYLAIGSLLYDVSNSSYNGLNVELTRRFSAGLQFKAAYTWSKDLDFVTGTSGGGGGDVSLFDTVDPKLNYGPASQNLPQKFVFSGGYELPFGHNKPWLSGLTGVGGKLVSGWQINSIVTAENGLPFTPLEGSNRSGNGETTGGPPSYNPAFTGSIITDNINQWFNPNAYILPAFGTYGNVQKDSLPAPSQIEVDASVFKTTAVTERISVQFRTEAFNLLNRVNFGPPATTVFSGTSISSGAGLITSAAPSRQIQFALKLIF